MPWGSADATRLVAELQCCGTTVKLYEDGDLQDDGTILWSGCAAGECEECSQLYVDYWEGTFKIGGSFADSEPQPSGASSDSPTVTLGPKSGG